MYVDFGSSHRTWAKLPGVNCRTARLILPLVVDMSLQIMVGLERDSFFETEAHTDLMLAHLYSRISRILQIFRPHQMPKPLHNTTSKIRASHQHSTKFGNRCAKAISVISHIIDMAHRMPMCLIRIA